MTITGKHDRYFPLPAINTTYDRILSAGSNPRFVKRVLMTANRKHVVIDGDQGVENLLAVIDQG